MSENTVPRLVESSIISVALRLILIVGLPTLIFCTAFMAQGLKGWTNVLAASIVELTPAYLMGRLIWLHAPQMSRPSPIATLLRHAAAAVLFAVMWTTVVGAAVLLLQPAARENFFGIAIWHALAGLAVYGMIAAASLATNLTRRLHQQALLASQAELGALRARLNPHFLFNTLHTINALVRRDPTRAEDALQQFGNLMHYVLECDGSALIALEDEMNFVRGYLAIEALRLGPRLKIVEEIDDEALDCGVPPLLLQPLVENAVRHGIDQKLNGGTVTIQALVEKDRLLLAIEDDGVGSTATCLADPGVGLSTTRRQVEAQFGDDANVDVITSLGNGFRIVVILPALVPQRTAI